MQRDDSSLGSAAASAASTRAAASAFALADASAAAAASLAASASLADDAPPDGLSGDEIPLGWATDKDGRPTTDPKAGFDGFLMPLGGHKGFGLSLLVDILCGLITGGSFQHDLKSMYRYPKDPSNTAHLMIVINPLALMSKEQLGDRMQAFTATLKASPMWDPQDEMLLPGELEYRQERERRKTGIPLSAPLLAELKSIGTEMNLASTLEPLAA